MDLSGRSVGMFLFLSVVGLFTSGGEGAAAIDRAA
jgi:hypothetical protein